MPRILLLALFVAAALADAAGAVGGAPAFPELTQKVLDRYVLPRFEELEAATHRLASDLDAACRGERQRLGDARKDYEQAVLAWAAVEFLRFGPMSATGRPERFAFWPDPRGVVDRQVRGLIGRRDASALDAEQLKEKSVAVQGLTALEVLLADKGSSLTADDEEGRYRCRLGLAVAQSLDANARDILSEWGAPQGWRQRMLDAGPTNPSYRTEAEPPAEFARALITGLQMLQDRQVAPLIAAQATPEKPPRLPFARSGLSARYVAAAVASLKALYETMGLQNGVPQDKAWMTEWIATAFGRLAEDGPAAVEGIAGAAKDTDRERKLRMLRFHVEGIRKLVGRELAPRAGLTIGFNELDGD